MKKPFKRFLQVLLFLAVSALLVLAVRPRPVPVETGVVVSGPLRETVEAEGEARAHDRYTLAAPVTGRLMRIELHDGDRVAAGQVVAVMRPTPLDDRERDAAVARISASEALLKAAEEQAAHDRAELEQARRELVRTEQMARQGIATAQSLEQARTNEQMAANNLAAAEYRAHAASAQLREARAALLAAEPGQAGGRTISLRVPRSGPVLRILEKSERVVTAGTPLLMIGDPQKLEVVVDVLSRDAVRIRPGFETLLDEWGGTAPLKGRVRLVEPYAFTKISALGIEEQRVNVIIDFIGTSGPLGDGYRVLARITTWSNENVLKMPVSALFRQGESWCAFAVEQGKVTRRTVTTGHRNQSDVEILGGLGKGEIIVLHPSGQLEEGMRIKEQ